MLHNDITPLTVQYVRTLPRPSGAKIVRSMS